MNSPERAGKSLPRRGDPSRNHPRVDFSNSAPPKPFIVLQPRLYSLSLSSRRFFLLPFARWPFRETYPFFVSMKRVLYSRIGTIWIESFTRPSLTLLSLTQQYFVRTTTLQKQPRATCNDHHPQTGVSPTSHDR